MNFPRRAMAIGTTVALVALAILAVFLYDSGGGNEDYEVLVINSMSIESGSYFPRFWVNVSEPQYGFQYDFNFVLYNETGARAQSGSPMTVERHNNGADVGFMGKLNLYYLEPGVYRAHLYLNATLYGFESPDLFLRGHAFMNITISGERPPPPRITSMKVEFNSTSSRWEYSIEMVDPDADGDTVAIWLGGKSGYVIYNARRTNTENAVEWTCAGEIDVELTEDVYGISAEVTDVDGPKTYAWTLHFYP